jgi:hypothetical protein
MANRTHQLQLLYKQQKQRTHSPPLPRFPRQRPTSHGRMSAQPALAPLHDWSTSSVTSGHTPRRSPSNAPNARDASHAATCSCAINRSCTSRARLQRDRATRDEKALLGFHPPTLQIVFARTPFQATLVASSPVLEACVLAPTP